MKKYGRYPKKHEEARKKPTQPIEFFWYTHIIGGIAEIDSGDTTAANGVALRGETQRCMMGVTSIGSGYQKEKRKAGG